MLTVAQIAERVGGEVCGPHDLCVTGFAGLDDAGDGDLVFIASGKWASRWSHTAAKVALVTHGVEVPDHDESVRSLIRVDNAELALMMLLESVAAELRPQPHVGLHETSIVDPSVSVPESASIGAGAIVGQNVRLGEDVVIAAGAVIGQGAQVGNSAQVLERAVLAADCTLGSRSILHPGAVIGGEGFGFRPDPETGLPRRVPHLGTVEIGDDVEIGVNTCVDRGKFGATRIGHGTKIDNLVQVAHNVQIGQGVLIAGQAGIAGSASIGDGAVLGAQVGVAEHVKIGEGARIAATSGVMRDVPPQEDYAGTPARPARQTLREVAALSRLPDLVAARSRRESS